LHGKLSFDKQVVYYFKISCVPNLTNSSSISKKGVKVAAKDVDQIAKSLKVPMHVLKMPIAKYYGKYNSYSDYGDEV
jgi:hypothetical protein